MVSWYPKSLQCLAGEDLKTFLSDSVAGVTVGLLALPLAMAFAIASRLPPQAGSYCAGGLFMCTMRARVLLVIMGLTGLNQAEMFVGKLHESGRELLLRGAP